jgi:hypothetical protein
VIGAVRVRGWFRFQSGNWLTGGIHILILAIAGEADSPVVWGYAFIAMALVSFAAWVANYHRQRDVANTPASNIVSAAQGYVELAGRAEPLPGSALHSRLGNLPCVWFQYQIEKKTSDNKWTTEDWGVSDQPFLIRDATGQCVVDPDGAEMVIANRKVWTEGDFRYTEWTLLPGTQICALGDFATVGGANSDLDLNADLSTLLAEWKKNQPELARRFDLNHDGTVDLKEWELARRAARREIEARHREIRMTSGTNVLRRPANGHLFLVSDYMMDKLIRRYRIWSWVHVLIFCGASAGACALL